MTKIESLEQLKEVCQKEERVDCFISLNGCRSSKSIAYYHGYKRPWDVFNEIDETYQSLNDQQIMDEKHTNIGKAILLGAFFQY